MPGSETMQVHTGHSSATEIVRKIGFLNRHKKAGSDEQFSSFKGDNNEVLESELTGSSESVWTRGGERVRKNGMNR